MKKTGIINIFLLIILMMTILLSFSAYVFFQSPSSITAFRQYSNPSYKISKDYVEMYHSDDSQVRIESKENIINIILKNLHYEKWKEFSDYIQLMLFEEKILPGDTIQLIAVLNLSKDLAVIAIFDQVEEEFLFHSKIENIAPVQDIQFLTVSSHSHKLLAVYQELDERLGSFFYQKFLEIYLYFPQGFRNIWSKILYFEEIYKETWFNPEGDAKLWHKVIEETVIDYVQTNPLKINTLTSLKKYSAQSANFPEENQFFLIHSYTYQRSYYWSEQYHTFILGEVTKDVFLSDTALLEDMEISIEVLYGIQNLNYKIVTSKGEILYLPKNKFQRMFQNFNEE